MLQMVIPTHPRCVVFVFIYFISAFSDKNRENLKGQKGPMDLLTSIGLMGTLTSAPQLLSLSPGPNLTIPSPAANPATNQPQPHALSLLIDRCTNIHHLKQLHAQALRTGFFFHPYCATRLLTACSFSAFRSLDYARKVFDQIPQSNLHAWNTLIRGFATGPEPIQSLLLLVQMLEDSPYSPNKFTFPFLVKAAARVSSLRVGEAIHGMAIKGSFDSDLFVSNSLIHFYASCGELDLAYLVFVGIDKKDVVSWNSIISGFGHGGYPEKAFELFERMAMEDVRPDDVTLVGVLSACKKKMDLEFGRRIYEYIERNRIGVSLTLRNAMLDLFVKCGSIKDARRLFDEMEEKDVFSWTTMIDGYARLNDYDAAKSFLYAMPRQEIAAWNVLISAYEQDGKPKEALAVFRELQLSKFAKPDEVTLLSTLSACAQMGAMDLGRWIHVYIKKQGIELNCYLATSLIDMYSKSGDVEKALGVFYSAEKRDVYIWSAMIAGLAMHGRGRDAIDMFLRMLKSKVKPNSVTFTNVLCACSHTGLVNEGRMFFNQMEPVYGLVPGVKHYACMIDMLGRAGFLEEAVEMIEKMPVVPSASVWGALLGACRIHGNVELAEKACKRLLELDPNNHGAYVLLSNIYATMGKWKTVSELRKHMKVSGLQKEPGCSSIEVNGVIHEFIVGDNSHPLSVEIHSKLDEIMRRLKAARYIPNKSHVLQFVEEEEMKEKALTLHSEKLAIAFGLISIGPSQPIRILKNLRICGDCHSVAKLISKLYSRDILLRDRYRFHHFSGGRCSCMDYW